MMSETIQLNNQLRQYTDQSKIHVEMGFMLNPNVAKLSDIEDIQKQIYTDTGLYTKPYVSNGTWRFVFFYADVMI